MILQDVIEFRKDLFFDGAVQADWFYSPKKAKIVSESYVFHGNDNIAIHNDHLSTIELISELSGKINKNDKNPMSMVISDYGTGKSHLVVTMAQILSGKTYMTDTYEKVLDNISKIDELLADSIRDNTFKKNFVIVINGMRDFNLNYEILKASERSLELYGLSSDIFRKAHGGIDSAYRFLERNAETQMERFETEAIKVGWTEKGNDLIESLRQHLAMSDDAYIIVNNVYRIINGTDIKWDEALSADKVLEILISEVCGEDKQFNSVILIFDELGRYLEYASAGVASKTGIDALQKMFEIAQNASGKFQMISMIQSDIQAFFSRVDNPKNIGRYLQRFNSNDKYYISSNMETVFLNLIEKKDGFKNVSDEINNHWDKIQDIYNKMKKFLPLNERWRDENYFYNSIVKGVYPIHPLAVYSLTSLSDYLQNRSSITLISEYIDKRYLCDATDFDQLIVMPEELLSGGLYVEILAAEQQGIKSTQHCIKLDNILSKHGDKLDDDCIKILRSNLNVRLLKFNTKNREEVIDALSLCSGIDKETIEDKLQLLEDTYAVLGYDEYANCFDFLEEANGAHELELLIRRKKKEYRFDSKDIRNPQIAEILGIVEPFITAYGELNDILTKEWEYTQTLIALSDISPNVIKEYKDKCAKAVSATEAKGILVWIYSDDASICDHQIMELQQYIETINDMPIVFMLINDYQERLKDLLIKCLVLINLDDDTIRKYERHYDKVLTTAKQEAKLEFDFLKKQRICVESNSVDRINERLSSYLSHMFSRLYPDNIPFFMDGFFQKKRLSPVCQKAYNFAIKNLLTSSLNETSIRNLDAQQKNRIETLMFISSSVSWKILDENYNLIVPQNNKVKKIYDEILNQLVSNEDILVKLIFEKYTKKPYGLCEESVMLMVVVIYALSKPYIKFRIDDKVYNATQWMQEIYNKSGSISYDKVKSTIIKYHKNDEEKAQYTELFDKIVNEKNVYALSALMSNYVELKNIVELPEDLEGSENDILLIKDKLVKTDKNWKEEKKKLQDLLEKEKGQSAIENALHGLYYVRNHAFENIFENSGFEYDDKSKSEIKDYERQFNVVITSNIGDFITSLKCNSVSEVRWLQEKCNEISNQLLEFSFDRYAQQLTDKVEEICGNIEEIENKDKIKQSIKSFAEEMERVKKYIPYSAIQEYMERAYTLKQQVESLVFIGENEKIKCINDMEIIIDFLTRKEIEKKKEIDEVWNTIASITRPEELHNAINKIQGVLRKGLDGIEKDRLDTAQNRLVCLQEDIKSIEKAGKNRRKVTELVNIISEKYSDVDIDRILHTFISRLDEMERSWGLKYLTLGDKDIKTVKKWKEDTTVLPLYLSDASLSEYSRINEEADRLISENKINFIVESFNDLSDEEKVKCMGLLVKSKC